MKPTDETDTVKVVRQQGMPSYRHHDFGNLYIQFDVKFPERLGAEGSMSKEEIAALESVLPPRVTPAPVPDDAMVDDYPLEDIDPTRESARGMGITDEDDDEMHQGHSGVQCATQ
jgi:DnaJ family protein A protein 2